MRHIRALWLLGNTGAIVSLWLHTPSSDIVKGAAVVVLCVGWAAAIVRACATHKWGLAALMAFFPLIVWGYIFGLGDRGHEPVPPPAPNVPIADIPTQPLRSGSPWHIAPFVAPAIRQPDEPLAMRQAREAIEEAERRNPDW